MLSEHVKVCGLAMKERVQDVELWMATVVSETELYPERHIKKLRLCMS